jgi:hypothetical protein
MRAKALWLLQIPEIVSQLETFDVPVVDRAIIGRNSGKTARPFLLTKTTGRRSPQIALGERRPPGGNRAKRGASQVPRQSDMGHPTI